MRDHADARQKITDPLEAMFLVQKLCACGNSSAMASGHRRSDKGQGQAAQ